MAKLTLVEESKSLNEAIRQQITYGQDELLLLSDEQLNYAPDPERWSKAQCLDHMNRAMLHYLPQLERIQESHKQQGKDKNRFYRPGFLGSTMAESMAPTTAQTIRFKMPTLKSLKPESSLNSEQVIGDFFENLHRLMKLVHALPTLQGKKRVKTPIPGFTIRAYAAIALLVNHNARHMVQLRRTPELPY